MHRTRFLLKQAAVVAATLAYALAMRDELLPRFQIVRRMPFGRRR